MIISPQIKKSAPIETSIQLDRSDVRINTVTELRILGVTIAYNLKWSAQSKSVRKAMTNKIGVLNRFGVTLNKNARQRILQAFISPKFTYCLPVWGHLNKTCTSSMNQALQRAARVVLHDKTAVLNCNTYSSTEILPFDNMKKLRCAVRVNALLSNDDYTFYLSPLLTNNGSQIVTHDITGRRFNVPISISLQHLKFVLIIKLRFFGLHCT